MRRRFGRGRHWHDFWHAWREERQRLWKQHGEPGWPPGAPPPYMARAWREFFLEFMGISPEKHWAFGGRRFTPWHQGIDSFNPFVASLLSKGGGLLPLLVLHLLAEKPRYGNEIMDLITAATRGQWVANPGAIYPLMGDLENQGLVAGEWEDPRKRTVRIYRLTDAGADELERLRAIIGPRLKEAADALLLLSEMIGGANGPSEAEGDSE